MFKNLKICVYYFSQSWIEYKSNLKLPKTLQISLYRSFNSSFKQCMINKWGWNPKITIVCNASFSTATDLREEQSWIEMTINAILILLCVFARSFACSLACCALLVFLARSAALNWSFGRSWECVIFDDLESALLNDNAMGNRWG